VKITNVKITNVPIIAKHREALAYLICGVLTTAVSLLVFWLVYTLLGLHVVVTNTLAVIAAVIFAFFVNKICVFRSEDWSPATLGREVLSFFSGRLATYLLETALLFGLVRVAGLPAFWCKVGTNILVLVGNFIISKWLVFKKVEEESNESA